MPNIVNNVSNAFRTSALFRASFDSAMFLLLVKLRSCYGCLMGVEPLPDIRDGILVERLVKTVRIENGDHGAPGER